MKPQKPEIIAGDPALRFPWILTAAVYLLLVIWFEPMLDDYLKLTVFEPTPEGVQALNETKHLFSAWGFTLLRSIPLLMFLWLGWQIFRSKRIPPPGIRLPFSVPVIKRKTGEMIGMGMIAVALLSLLREVGQLSSTLSSLY